MQGKSAGASHEVLGRDMPGHELNGSTERTPRTRGGETLQQCVLRSLDQYFADLDGARPHALYDMVTMAVERPLLEFAMARAERNQSAAAELLGINRNTLHKKLQKHGLV